MNGFEYFNSLRVSVDWFAFTSDLSHFTDVITLLGLHFGDFKECPRGARGYRRMIKHEAVECSILYDGNDDMGIHVEITGSAFGYVFASFMEKHKEKCVFGDVYDTPWEFTHLIYFLDTIASKSQNISRLDIAIDDFTGDYFSIDDIMELVNSSSCVSKFKTFKCELSKKICDLSYTGKTVYFGSRTSDIFLRVYDKALEQSLPDMDWVRWEFELKNDMAVNSITQIREMGSLSLFAMSLLNTYVRFIVHDNDRRTRCSSLPKWLSFVDGVGKVSLFVKAEFKTINDKREWFDRQVGPTFAKILDADGGSMEFITNNLKQWAWRGGIDVGEI